MTEPTKRDHADVVVMPPRLYLVALVSGIVAKWLLGGAIAPGNWIRLVAGTVALVAGLAMAVSFAKAFTRAGQEKSPRTPTPGIIDDGLYRYTRNPAYVGLTLVLVGLGLLLDNPWILATLLVVLPVMHFGVILREEAYLEARFGEEYLAYKKRVRRWV